MEDKNNQKGNAAMLFMHNPDPLFCIGADGHILTMNPAAEELKIIQYKDGIYSSEDLWLYLFTKEDHKGDSWTFEVVSNNRTYSFSCRNSPSLGYCNAFGRDVTQQKRNEEDLLRLSLVASANEDGVVFNNDEGKILWVNEGFCKLVGFTKDEVIGKSTLDFCTGPLTPNEVLEKIKASMGVSESFNTELIHYRKDGSWFWGRVRGQSFKNGGDKHLQYFAVVEDISLEKDKEEQLKVLSQIAESNLNAVIITDKEGLITWVNKSFAQITGYKQDEVIGKKPGDLLQGPDTNPETIVYLRKQIAGGQSFNAEIYNYSKSGKPYWLRIQGQPIKNAAGELTGFFAVEEDITHEKEVQERIKQSEDRFRLALEKIGDNVWEHDYQTGKTVFSKTNNGLWGYDINDFDDDGVLWWDSVFPEDLPLVKKNYAQYKNGEIDSHNVEYRIVHKNGTVRWVLDRGVVLEKGQQGKPLRSIGTQTDITKIKQTEISLEQHVKQFKSLSENIPGVIYEYEFRKDGSEGFRYISPAIERIFGIKPDDFYNYLNYIHPDDQERIKRKNEHCRNTLEPFYDESLLVIPGSPPRWHSVHSSFSYVSQTGSNVFTGFMKDITERKFIEKTLVANEEKYRSIIANMELGLLEVDNQGIITYANNSFCTMSGYRIDELLGNSAAKLFLVVDNHHLEIEKRKRREKGIADAYEIETRDKNGNKKWWLVSGAPRYNDKQELVGSIGIHLDITNQKKQEVELIEARIKAEHLAQTKDTFLANMSHEIRTPMNAIMGMSNQLTKTILSPQQHFYLDTILSASDNLLVIINDILDLSKIEAGKLSFENIGFEIKAVIENAIKVVTHKAEEKGLNLNTYFLDDNISPVLIGDPFRINQVLLNLMTNAIKFTEKGSVDLICRLLKDNAASQLIQIEVKDTGSGMEESFVKVLFDKFSQEFESVARQYGGTGLGMSICKELIELMGGEIVVESKKGTGTTIAFTLELKKGNNTDLPEKFINHFAPDFLLGRKILITDDNDLNRLVGSIILKNYGADVLMAENGEKAMELINNEDFDIVLMDIQMPVLNGFEATKKLREAGSNLPIIALTAAAIKGERENCIESGMNDYITKPFKEDEFLKTIEKWLKQSGGDKKISKPIPEKYPLYDLRTLKEISRGNEVFVKKMIDMFCEQTPLMMKAMSVAYQQNDFEQLGAIAHKLKPSIDNLNIISLKQLIREIETISKNDERNSSLFGLLNEAENIITDVVKTMKQEYAG